MYPDNQDALRRRRVDRLREAVKADVAQARLFDRLDELLHGSRQTVELPVNDRVAAAGVLSASRRAGRSATAPDICLMKIFSHPASFGASCRKAKFRSSVETRA